MYYYVATQHQRFDSRRMCEMHMNSFFIFFVQGLFLILNELGKLYIRILLQYHKICSHGAFLPFAFLHITQYSQPDREVHSLQRHLSALQAPLNSRQLSPLSTPQLVLSQSCEEREWARVAHKLASSALAITRLLENDESA